MAGLRLMIPPAADELLPAPRCVAVLAVNSELQPVSIVLPPRPVTLFTISRSTCYYPLEMAFAAFHCAVPSHQGEIAVVMSLDEVPRPIRLSLLRADISGGGIAVKT